MTQQVIVYSFKLYKSKHKQKLIRLLNIAGLVWNHCVALQRKYYRLTGKCIHRYRLSNHIAKLKRTRRFTYIRKLDAQAVQDIIARLDRAYSQFFADCRRKVRCSPPKFRKIKLYSSFTLRQSGWKLCEAKAKIYICGHWYKYFKSRNISGKIKTVTIKRDILGDIYVYLACASEMPDIPARAGQAVGYDFGLKKFLTASDGKDIDSPSFFTLNAKAIRDRSRSLCRCENGSRNRIRARLKLARTYRKMTNQRRDFHFKTARRICQEYALVCIEDLNIHGMARLWGRKIHDLCFYSFVQILIYEAGKFGTRTVKVDRYYASSQICSTCGHKNTDVRKLANLKAREWVCPECGTHHDRDRNAAINIMKFGLSS